MLLRIVKCQTRVSCHVISIDHILFTIIYYILLILFIRRVCRYQRGNQNPYIEEEQTTQWPKEKVQKDKQRSTKHTYQTKDRVNYGLVIINLLTQFNLDSIPLVNHKKVVVRKMSELTDNKMKNKNKYHTVGPIPKSNIKIIERG